MGPLESAIATENAGAIRPLVGPYPGFGSSHKLLLWASRLATRCSDSGIGLKANVSPGAAFGGEANPINRSSHKPLKDRDQRESVVFRGG